MEPQIRFCTSADGTRIAYATMGPVLRPELQHYRDRMLPAVPQGEEERE